MWKSLVLQQLLPADFPVVEWAQLSKVVCQFRLHYWAVEILHVCYVTGYAGLAALQGTGVHCFVKPMTDQISLSLFWKVLYPDERVSPIV